MSAEGSLEAVFQMHSCFLFPGRRLAILKSCQSMCVCILKRTEIVGMRPLPQTSHREPIHLKRSRILPWVPATAEGLAQACILFYRGRRARQNWKSEVFNDWLAIHRAQVVDTAFVPSADDLKGTKVVTNYRFCWNILSHMIELVDTLITTQSSGLGIAWAGLEGSRGDV